MNKTYRVIWNDARNCFVVAGENAKGKHKPKSARSAVAAAVGALFLAPGAALAFCAGTTPISTVLTAPQCYGNQNVTVNSGGGIRVVNNTSAATAAYVSVSPYTGTFTNNGTISAAAMRSGSASASGVYVSGILSGTLTNAGTISASASNQGSAANAYGVRVASDLSGTLINTSTGTISATAIGTNNANRDYAYGVSVGGVLSGSLQNFGTISASAKNSYSPAYAYGVNVNSDLSGSLLNAGTISANAISSYPSPAYAYGIYIGGNLAAGGTLTNSGTIAATANGRSGTAYGVYVSGNLDGTLANTSTGTISAVAVGFNSANAYAYGVYVNGSLTGTLTNSGTISASARAGNNNQASAYGLYVGNGVSGTLTNSGTISAVGVSPGSYGDAYGVQIYGGITGGGKFINTGTISAVGSGQYASVYGLNVSCCSAMSGTLTNAGTISAAATGTGPSSNPRAYGVYVGSTVDGAIANSGSISAVSTYGGSGYGSAAAYGLYVSTLNGTLTNSGTISASVTAGGASGYAYAYGVVISGNLAGSFTNTGTISASAIANRTAYAYGFANWSTLSGALNNSGTISAVANGKTGGGATGVYVGTLTGTINNSGTISAVGQGAVLDSNVYSIRVNGSGTINNMAGGLLDGQVYAGGSVNLNNAGTIDTRLQASSVGGNYTQSVTGVLRIGAMSNATHGVMNVTGTANLAAGTGIEVNAATGNTLAAGTLSSVITSGGLTMSGVTVTKNILALNYTAVAAGNNVNLVATPTGLTTVTAAVSGGAGASVGGVLDSLLANINNQPQPLQNYLYSLGSQTTAQGVADSVQKILPLINTGITQANVGASQGVNNVVVARLEDGLGRSAGDKFYGDRKVWLKPFGSWASQDNRNGVSGYDATTAGLVGGVDADVGDNRLGVAFGYARSNVDGNASAAPQNAKVDSYQLVFYGDHRLSPATDVNFQAGIGLHDNNGRRTIAFGATSLQATSNYGSWSGNLGAGIAHSIQWNEATTFTPSLRADYTWIHNKSYNESGAGALGLSVGANDFAKFIVAADGKFVHAISDRSKVVGNVGLGYDLINEHATITSAFAGAPTAAFSTPGIKPGALLVRGGLGMTYRTGEGVEVTTRYDLEARSGFTNQTVSVNARWSF